VGELALIAVLAGSVFLEWATHLGLVSGGLLAAAGLLLLLLLR
jgi:hypothetical protein